MKKYGEEPDWTHDMRRLEDQVRERLKLDGFPEEQREGRGAHGYGTIVQTGFHLFIADPAVLAVTWNAAYNTVIYPNDARAKRLEMAEKLAAAGFDAETSPGSSEVRVRRGP